MLTGEVDDFATIGPAVDQIADEDQTVVFGEGEAVKQLGELLVTTMDVADCDDTSVHSFECGKFASVPPLWK